MHRNRQDSYCLNMGQHKSLPGSPIPEAFTLDSKGIDFLGSVLPLEWGLHSLCLVRDSCFTCPTTLLILEQIRAHLAGLSSRLGGNSFFRVLKKLF